MKTIAKTGFWAILLALISATTGYASDDVMIIESPPKMAIGDIFVYQGFRDLDDAKNGNSPKWTSTNTVIEIKDDGGFIMSTGGTVRTYNKDGNLIKRERKEQVRIYTPFWPVYHYPMKVGDKYSMDFTHTWGDNGEAYYYVKIKVMGWENITVPAGTFKALKVEMWGSYEHPPNYVRASITFTVWLAPEVKMRPILMSEERWWNGGSESFYESLKIFSFKK